jgi:hypothetical protein
LKKRVINRKSKAFEATYISEVEKMVNNINTKSKTLEATYIFGQDSTKTKCFFHFTKRGIKKVFRRQNAVLGKIWSITSALSIKKHLFTETEHMLGRKKIFVRCCPLVGVTGFYSKKIPLIKYSSKPSLGISLNKQGKSCEISDKVTEMFPASFFRIS